ncbi:DUF6350 family protein [Streptomyces sp. NPDC093795]|uniref:cell division protein PerM n=1 Tax=Streptomyces sp. NPDC093795 TaxID=3366051 RepID=UPI0037F8FB19
MTHVTEYPLVRGGRSAALAAACVRGAVAAGLGLGALAVLVVAAWISSPHPDSGPGGALHLAAGLWLLAHGVDLVRTDTLSGLPAPLGVVPLLLTALPVWLLHRAARDTLDAGDEDDRPRPSASGTVAAVAGGYLLVAAAVVVYSVSGPLPADLITAGFWLPAVAAGAAGAGVWTALGRPLPGQRQAAAALRAAGLGLVTLLGGGAVAAAVSLAWHASEAQAAYTVLAGEWSGRVAVLLLVLALLPNMAVWGAAYGLGPGFTLGTGALATPLGLAGDPAVPPFPLLAALPAEGRGTWVHWAAAAAPLAAAVVQGHLVGRSARNWAARDTALTALGAAWGSGTAVAVLTAATGGPLGTGRLSAFGPVWWQTGAATVLWGACLGAPVALGVRAWRRRSLRPKPLPTQAPPRSAGVGAGTAGVARAAGTTAPASRANGPTSGVVPGLGSGIGPTPGSGAGLGSGIGPAPGSGSGLGSGIGPAPGSGSGLGSGIGPTPGSGAGLDSGSGLGAGIGQAPASGLGPGLDSGSGLGAGIGQAPASGLGPGLGAGIGQAPGSGLGPGLGAGTGLSSTPGPGPGLSSGLGLGSGVGLGPGYGLGPSSGPSPDSGVAPAPAPGPIARLARALGLGRAVRLASGSGAAPVPGSAPGPVPPSTPDESLFEGERPGPARPGATPAARSASHLGLDDDPYGDSAFEPYDYLPAAWESTPPPDRP